MSMERPVYHLKGVVRKGAAATEDFVGPLDLILHLLKKNQIAIRDIPLAGILDQFVTWMSARRALDLEVAGEFIAMASHLMLLKTRMVLSEEDRQAQEEMEELIASLEARAAAGQFPPGPGGPAVDGGGLAAGKRLLVQGAGGQVHPAGLPLPAPAGGAAPGRWGPGQGQAAQGPAAAVGGIPRGGPARALPGGAQDGGTPGPPAPEGTLRWEDIVRTSGSKSEVTAAFLALLELCRRGNIHLDGGMDNPWITPSEGPNPT